MKPVVKLDRKPCRNLLCGNNSTYRITLKNDRKPCKFAKPNESKLKIIIKHRNEARYNCDKCTKSYWSSESLRRHRRRDHENMRYKCNQCNLEFTTYE